MIRTIFLIISLIFLLFLSVTVIPGYIGEHGYYNNMLANSQNWLILISSVVSAFIPVLYIIFSKRKTFLKIVSFVFLGLFIFGILFISFRQGLVGSGLIMFLINSFIIFFIGVLFILGILSLGTFIKNKLLKLKDSNIFDVLLNFGIGLASFLIINYVLILSNIFFSWLSWLLFLIIVSLIYFQRNKLLEFQEIFLNILKNFSRDVLSIDKLKLLGLGLLVASLMYYFFGFLLSYIPYPTAWDANHAYMFYPKMWAFNDGYYWFESAMGKSPYMWLSYIAFWFNLFIPFESFWISADTFAVAMNFLSGLFVLLLGIGLVRESIEVISLLSNKVGFISKKSKSPKISEYAEEKSSYEELDKMYDKTKDDGGSFFSKEVAFYMGWFMLLLWLTSGMGAFLVFVDNKTDLGVLTMVVLAIYSGFVFLRKMYENNEKPLEYIAISGFMFAMAVMAKPTALFDVVTFVMFLSMLWIGILLVVGIFFLVIGLLSNLEFRGIKNYITPDTGKIHLIFGTLLGGIDVLKSFFFKQAKYLYYFLVWGAVFALTLIVLKGPYEYTDRVINEKDISPVDFAKDIFMSKTSSKANDKNDITLLASTSDKILSSALSGDTKSNNNCSLDSLGLKNSDGLYKNLTGEKVDSRSEDVGRYIGYGWKDFKEPFWSIFLPSGNYCWSLNKSAEVLCNNSKAVSNFNVIKLESILDDIPKDTQGYTMLSGMLNTGEIANINTEKFVPNDNFSAKHNDKINKLEEFYKNHSMKVSKDGTISLPFKYIVPFNISFNWSLQNHSSYYTDIGYVWLFLMFFTIISFIYGLLKLNKALVAINLATIFGWTIWFFVGGAILWYGIGLIIWTILSFVAFLTVIYNEKHKMLYISFVSIFAIIGIYQLLLNFIRISTQGGGGPFMWYRQGVGQETTINNQLQRQQQLKTPYTSKDVFDRQFAHYKKFINLANNRQEGEGIYLAGTYARYFIKNQSNIIYDQFLKKLYKWSSDSNICKSYLRLKDQDIKYITIDPNIGTVVMGQGNKSLFNRFFADINNISGKIEKDGVMTMLAKLYMDGYIDYKSSNNLGAKYAFDISDEKIENYFDGNISEEDKAVIRGAMSVARYPDVQKVTSKYFNDKRQGIVQLIINIAYQRVQNGKFIGDLADMYGKQINEQKVLKTVQKITQNQATQNNIGELNKGEKEILAQYMNLLQAQKQNSQQFNKALQQMIVRSISSSSQVITLEVK